MLEDCEEVYVLTPSRWNLYAHNESHMLDWKGEMVEPKDMQTILLSEIEEDADISAACYIGHVESQAVIRLLNSQLNSDNDGQCQQHSCPKEDDEVASVLTNINPLLTDTSLFQRLKNRNELSQFQMSIGSTTASGGNCIFSDEEITSDNVSSDESCANEEMLLDNIFKKTQEGTFNPDEIMLSDVHAGRNQGVKAKDLAKLWRIDVDKARQTLDITSQREVRTDNPKLSRNFSTNDRTLRYKHLKEYFYMDNLFATSKAGKSSRGHTCAQLFVSDKCFVYVVLLESEGQGQVLQAIKQFAKSIGAPDALIHDASKSQKAQDVR